jgi:hypothetical protein
MNSIEVKDQQWPLLYVEVSGVPTDTAFAKFLTDYTKYLDRAERYAVVFDARKSGNTPSSQRKAMTLWMKQHHDRFADRCLGVAFAMESVLVRMILKGILMVQPMPTTHVVCPTVEQAQAWCQEKLKAASR